MRLFRRGKASDPDPGSYQERLRAIGRKLDRDAQRFRVLAELPDGFLLKADDLAVRPQGSAGSGWTTRTYWLRKPELKELIDDAHREREELP